MASEVELQIGIATFKIDLSEFVSAIRGLVDGAIGANEQEQARQAIKEMVAEVRKTFDAIVDALTPFYSLTTASEFSRQFDAYYASFKGLYLKRSDVVRTHCHVVKEQFGKLQRRRAWMANVPLAQRAYVALENTCEKWLFYDWDIATRMEIFFRALDSFLDEVRRSSDPKQDVTVLQAGLKAFEADFLEIKARLAELDALGGKL